MRRPFSKMRRANTPIRRSSRRATGECTSPTHGGGRGSVMPCLISAGASCGRWSRVAGRNSAAVKRSERSFEREEAFAHFRMLTTPAPPLPHRSPEAHTTDFVAKLFERVNGGTAERRFGFVVGKERPPEDVGEALHGHRRFLDAAGNNEFRDNLGVREEQISDAPETMISGIGDC